MKLNKNMDNEFNNNLNYIITNLEKDIVLAKNLKDGKYFLLTKNEIINSLNQIYEIFKVWKELYLKKEYNLIINNYSLVENIINDLELCLTNYDKQFHIEGISYSIYNIGKIFCNLKRRNKYER